jgi:hypothetical protein
MENYKKNITKKKKEGCLFGTRTILSFWDMQRKENHIQIKIEMK